MGSLVEEKRQVRVLGHGLMQVRVLGHGLMMVRRVAAGSKEASADEALLDPGAQPVRLGPGSLPLALEFLDQRAHPPPPSPAYDGRRAESCTLLR